MEQLTEEWLEKWGRYQVWFWAFTAHSDMMLTTNSLVSRMLAQVSLTLLGPKRSDQGAITYAYVELKSMLGTRHCKQEVNAGMMKSIGPAVGFAAA